MSTHVVSHECVVTLFSLVLDDPQLFERAREKAKTWFGPSIPFDLESTKATPREDARHGSWIVRFTFVGLTEHRERS